MDIVVIVISSWTSPLIFLFRIDQRYSFLFAQKTPLRGGNFSRIGFVFSRRFAWKTDYHRVENLCILHESTVYLSRIIGIIHVYESTTERGKRELVILFWYEFSNRTFEQREEVKFVDKNLVANFSLKLSFHTRRGEKWEKSVETWKFVEF